MNKIASKIVFGLLMDPYSMKPDGGRAELVLVYWSSHMLALSLAMGMGHPHSGSSMQLVLKCGPSS